MPNFLLFLTRSQSFSLSHALPFSLSLSLSRPWTCILCNTVNQNENNLNTWLDSINLSLIELDSINLSHDSLIELGATNTVKDLVDIEKEDIDELGLKKLEKKRLWRAVEKVKSSALGNEDDEDDEVRSDGRMVGGSVQLYAQFLALSHTLSIVFSIARAPFLSLSLSLSLSVYMQTSYYTHTRTHTHTHRRWRLTA